MEARGAFPGINRAVELIRLAGRPGIAEIPARIPIALGCLLISIALSLGSVLSTTRRGPTDLPPLYSAGVVMRSGEDPYLDRTICQISRSNAGRRVPCMPYLDLPPFTAIMLPISYLSLHRAAYVWVAMMLVCALVLAMLAVWLAQLPLRGSIVLCLISAGILVFYPVKHGLANGQSDALSAMLALTAIALASTKPVRGGALAALAVFVKPQTIALSMVALAAKRHRVLVGALIAAGATAAALELATISGHSPGTLSAWYQVARRSHTTPTAPLVVLQLLLAVSSAAWVLARLRQSEIGVVQLCALAAAFNVILGSLVYLQTDSVTLLLVPLVFALKPWLRSSEPPPIRFTVMLGIVCGLLSGDALFAISHYSGWSHAILPWATAAMFAIGVVLLKPSLRWLALTGLLTNLVVTFPPFPPPAQTEFAAIAAFGLLVVLGTRVPGIGVVLAAPTPASPATQELTVPSFSGVK